MPSRTRNIFTTIKTEGSLLPADLLLQIAEGDQDIEGLTSESYHLARTERLNEAATRAWNRLQGAWETFSSSIEEVPDSDAGTSLTRERWLLILFQELGYGRLTTHKAFEIGGQTYPISHVWQQAPIHLVSFRYELDKRTPGVRGAARVSPHSLVQEFLNRSDDHLWGFISNGLRLRILRDNISFTRPAYVEFDLQATMDGETYSDFFLMYLLCHQSRVEVPEGKTPEHCLLEKWYNTAAQQGVRALETLREGVQKAIETLGGGFVSHPANSKLREDLRSGGLTTKGYYRQVLRQVYRLLFLFVAEDRQMLFSPDSSIKAQEIYTKHYSTQRLRVLAGKRRGTRHPDLFQVLRLIFEKLRAGCEELALPALGSNLFKADTTSALNDADIANCDLLKAIRYLAYTIDENVLRPINYRNLGPEELGSVYESLLEMHPNINIEAKTFNLEIAAGSERKTTGSYYTPTSLVNCLLDSALEPIIDEAVQKKTSDEAEHALLKLKVCDPACGSGHFLIAAAHRIAKRLAAIRAGEDEPAPESVTHALRDVIGHCIYGVDMNPTAVELCKVSLWIEALEPGKPLSFLDHHIKCGNSLLGTTPALMQKGIPDNAFKPIEGDDKALCREFKQQNKDERKGQAMLFYGTRPWDRLGNLPVAMLNLDDMPDDTVNDIEQKQKKYAEIINSTSYKHGHLLADAWCAAFVFHKTEEVDYPITEKIYREIERNPHSVSSWMEKEIKCLASQYQFLHWHFEFPDVFRTPTENEAPENEQTSWSGGFDCILGNPPWETLEFKEQEWFATAKPDIAVAKTTARKNKIAKLAEDEPELYGEYKRALRQAEGERTLVRNTSRYPLCARGKINTFSIFAELKRNLLNLRGRVGCIVPSGIATDDTTKFFFQDLMDTASLVSLYSFENEEFIFPEIHHATKFCLLTMSGSAHKPERADFVFFARQTPHLTEEDRHFDLSAEEIALLNPNTRTCPIFRSKRDAELTKYIYRRVPVLIKDACNKQREENPWGVNFKQGVFNMSSDSNLFRTREQLETEGFFLEGNIFHKNDETFLPLYEGKMFWHFDHRFGTYEGQTEAQANQGKLPELDDEQHAQPALFSLPRYWASEKEVDERVPKYPELVSTALKLPANWRKEAVRKALCYWAAGFYRIHKKEEKAQELLRLALPIHASETMLDAFNRWLTDAAVEKMQERFPLTEEDVDRILDSLEDPLPIAQELVDRFSPHWLVGFRDVTSAVVLRTCVFSFIPLVAVGHTAPLLFLEGNDVKSTSCLLGCMNSFVLDYAARQSVGGSHLTYSYLRQLPVLPPKHYDSPCPWMVRHPLSAWLRPRVLELAYTAWDMEELGQDRGYNGPPFVWDDERRFLIRAELDAAFFHLYLDTSENWRNNGTPELLKYFPAARDAVGYIMDSFRILRERDEAGHCGYRTKDTILEIYDKMAEAVRIGQPYQTILDPPPGPPSDDLPEWQSGQPKPANWPVHIHPPKGCETAVIEKKHPIFTIGHSNTSVDKLISLLKQNKIQVLADVRSVPYSRHVPQANREAIERAVKAAGIKYLFMGGQLGGRPKDIEIKDEQGNLDYSKLASTKRFREGMDRLLNGASQYHVCLMCSEEDPSRCHRSLLISRELDKLGVEIRHIRRDGHIESQGKLEKQIPTAHKGLFSEK